MSNHRRKPLTSVQTDALHIDHLRAAGEANPHAACQEYGVTPRDYSREPDDWKGAWADYEEDRIQSIILKSVDPEAVNLEAERLWIARHR